MVGEPWLALLIRVFWSTKRVCDAFLPENTNKIGLPGGHEKLYVSPDCPYSFAYFGARNTFVMHCCQKTRLNKASLGGHGKCR